VGGTLSRCLRSRGQYRTGDRDPTRDLSHGLYLHHPSSLDHETGNHPERAARIRAIEEALAARDWLGLDREQAPAIDLAQLEVIHPESYVEAIRRVCEQGGGMLDVDTVASSASFDAALHSAGGALRAVDALFDGETELAFCGLRPPGHHAEQARAMGFCIFNNVAVAAQHALDSHGAERVLVLDWDVHHGNGTNDIFYDSSEVLYASLHQFPLYPGTGALTDNGSGPGEGFTLNLPVPPGSGHDEWLSLVQHVVVPVARAYRPHLVLVSAGFDAHRDDPLANCRLTEESYAALTAALRDLARELDAPLGFVLEGGYDLDALSSSVVAVIESALGDAEAPPVEMDSLAVEARAHYGRWWPVLN
jgi:acetoin utilization deacetylase AcuC-like enzyme